jgi:hypothetical protein
VKGIIFNLVEEVVTTAHGPAAWDAVLEGADLDGSYTSLGSYPDEDLLRLVGSASAALDLPPDDVVRAIGTGAIPLLADRYPHFFDGHSSTKSFLLTLNNIIHPEVKKLYPGSIVPDFTFRNGDESALTIGYQSARKLCALAEGFIIGAAAHYGETVTLGQSECMNRGDDHCLIDCRFAPG